jgi:hypothetical protein
MPPCSPPPATTSAAARNGKAAPRPPVKLPRLAARPQANDALALPLHPYPMWKPLKLSGLQLCLYVIETKDHIRSFQEAALSSFQEAALSKDGVSSPRGYANDVFD